MISKYYRVAIDSVDGERGWEMYSPDVTDLLEFLAKYDHEGSDIGLFFYQNMGVYRTHFGEDVYKELRRLVDAEEKG